METAKQAVEKMVHNLPDDASIEDIHYHLYVLEKIRNGLESAKNEGTIPHEEAVKRLSKWIIK